MRFSERVMTIESSATLDITAKAKAMQGKGEDVVILAAGEPDFDTPNIIKEAAIKAIRDGFTKYTPSSGTKTLREAIARKLARDNSATYDINEIVVSNGAKHSLYNVLQVICNTGDEVLIVPPYWLSYPEMVKLAGARPVTLPIRKGNLLKVVKEDIEKAITKKTRAIIFNSPSNPAGVVYSEEELRKIAELCLGKGIMIISDEIYEKIIFDNLKHFSISSISREVRDITILVNGVSKSYAMTGWRIGYAAGDKKIMDMVSALQSHATSNPCSISQVAAECALTSDLENEIKNNCSEFQHRRDILMNALKGSRALKPYLPQGAFYLFCDISACGLNSVDFAQRLLDEKKVAVIPGAPFGDDGAIRISFATKKELIEKGARRIVEFAGTLAR